MTSFLIRQPEFHTQKNNVLCSISNLHKYCNKKTSKHPTHFNNLRPPSQHVRLDSLFFKNQDICYYRQAYFSRWLNDSFNSLFSDTWKLKKANASNTRILNRKYTHNKDISEWSYNLDKFFIKSIHINQAVVTIWITI